ncbi:hypothetical protein F4778DRAFT_802192 [Xylariomycetidae sp. FL2044]|nr:hypothetical protein F4778DRAFT_802192 [Xylariomycetidae sp. FL2044]
MVKKIGKHPNRISLVFLLVRIYSRVTGPRRLYWDDVLIIFAWLLALLSAICWQLVVDYLYNFLHLTGGLLWPAPQTFIQDTEHFYIGQLVVLIFFYTSLYSVKLSFLLFFKRLGQGVHAQKYIWWPILALTLATYFVCIGDIQYKCIVRPFAEIATSCSSDANVDFTLVTLKVNCAMDVLTDFLIMLIPFTMLWRVRIPWEKKLALAGLFSLVIITMVFSIVRVTVVSALTRQPDISWLYFWSSVEQCVAISVACLSAFPRLFQQPSRNQKPQYTPSDTYRSIMRRIKSRQHDGATTELSTYPGGDGYGYIRTGDNTSDHFPAPLEPTLSTQRIVPQGMQKTSR